MVHVSIVNKIAGKTLKFVLLLGLICLKSTILRADTSLRAFTDVATAIGQILEYYKAHYNSALNFDSLFALKIMQGHVKAAVREVHVREILQLLKTLSKDLEETINLAVLPAKSRNPGYFGVKESLTMQTWDIFKATQELQINHVKKIPPHSNPRLVNYMENNSDDCFNELTDPSSRSCLRINGDCLKLMFSPDLPAHYLVQQILYTLIGEVMGCVKRFDAFLRETHKSLDEVRREFCSNNYHQMKEMLDRGMHPGLEHLFLEEQFVCPSLGYREFLAPSHLALILSWQRPNGCFGADPPLHPRPLKGRAHGRNLKSVDVDSDLGVIQRRLLVDYEVRDGCLSYKTAMAGAALSIYLRHILKSDSRNEYKNFDAAISKQIKYRASSHAKLPARVVDYDVEHHKHVLDIPDLKQDSSLHHISDIHRRAAESEIDSFHEANSHDGQRVAGMQPPLHDNNQGYFHHQIDSRQSFFADDKSHDVHQSDKMVDYSTHSLMEMPAFLIIVTCFVVLVIFCRILGGRRWFLYRYKPLLSI